MDPEKVILVEASAGSGKTFRLTRAYLARLFSAFKGIGRERISPEQTSRILGSLLAITFTNKAAGEMRERIIRALKSFAFSSADSVAGQENRVLEKMLVEDTGISPERLAKTALPILERIVTHFGDFNVKTIDALMSHVVRVIAPDLRLPPEFEIEVDAARRVSEKGLAFMDDFSHNDWDKARSFLEDLAGMAPLRSWRVEEPVVDLLQRIRRLSLNRPLLPVTQEAMSGCRGKWSERTAGFVRAAVRLVTLMREPPLKGGVNASLNRGRIKPQAMADLDAAVAGPSPRVLKSLAAKSLFSNKAEDLLVKNADSDFSVRFETLHQAARKSLGEILFGNAICRVQQVQRFLEDFEALLARDREIVFVEEFSRDIRQRLVAWETDAMPYVYLKLSDRYRHFLFDEFQDTSQLQFQALAPLIDETLSSDPRASLFMVGDRKQAIYRWRGGDADLMSEPRLRREMSSLNLVAPDSIRESLDANWRSLRNIVAFNNQFWEQDTLKCALPDDAPTDALENFAHVRQRVAATSGDDGFLEVLLRLHPRDSEGEEKLSDLMLKDCVSAVESCREAGFRYGDIAVLTRTNRQGRRVMQMLASARIPSVSNESMQLGSSPVIRQLLLFLRFLEFPPDNLSFYGVVTGEVFMRRAMAISETEAERIGSSPLLRRKHRGALYSSFREEFPILWRELIEPLFRSIGFLPAYDLFLDLCARLKTLENFPESSAFVLRFGEFLHQVEKRGRVSVAQALEEWDRMEEDDKQWSLAAGDEGNRVRVQTLHKSKGLEFQAVILPILPESSSSETPLYEHDGRLLQMDSVAAAVDERLGEVFTAEKRRRLTDLLNLYYVGFTRACRSFTILVGAEKLQAKRKKATKPRLNHSFTDILIHHPLLQSGLDVVDSTAGLFPLYREGESSPAPGGEQEIKRGSEDLPVGKKMMTVEWQRRFLVFSTGVKSPSTAESRRGDRVHEVLAELGVYADTDSLLTALGSSSGAMLEKKDVEKLAAFLILPAAARFFVGEITAHREIDVAGRLAGRMTIRRLDRLVVAGDGVWVVDYKTGNEDPDSHGQQVAEYMNLVRPMFPEKLVRGVLLYTDLGRVEEVE